ncbi:MAG TPA: TAT-variant-translocated molybdopterin oxidoreductase [Pyrinomonadaceae bacterium]|nr:TAT-variant-translocated molybdopterin oxidoreductase [Pyrinomonadaceae bacterium]
MSVDDRHINFKLMREWILAHQDEASQRDAVPSPIDQSGVSTPRDVSSNGNVKKYWRSLEEFADTPEFHEFVQREYPHHAEEWDDPIERRTFLKLMGASLALAGISGCVYQPPEKIVPYVRHPEESVPGKALFFATAATVAGIATPVLVRSNEGRPTKIEGNPDHPHNRNLDPNDRGSSATDVFAQASVLGLYDPDRSQTVTFREEIRTWSTFLGEIRTALDEQRPKQGAGLRFLTETITSPTLAAQLKGILTEFPQAKWHQYEPVNRDNVRTGAIMAFGQPVHTIYNFDQATRILSLDADFLSAKPGTLRYARHFAAGRRVTEGKHEMSRLYVVETTPSNTGASADHRWMVKPSALEGVARQLAAKCGVSLPGTGAPFEGFAWVDPVTHDLQGQKGASIVIAGDEAPPAVHAIAHAMNAALGNVGKTVIYTDPLEANSVDQRESLRDLVQDIDAGRVELLVMLGGNPVYSTPVDLKLDFTRLAKAKLRVHLSSHKDETSELCHWHVPEAHYLESWGDTRAIDGTVSIVQPLIEPLYGSKTAHEVLAVFSDKYDRKAYEIVREYWQGQSAPPATPINSPTPNLAASNRPEPATGSSPAPTSDFESRWRQALHDGFIANTALPIKSVTAKTDWANQAGSAQAPSSGYEIVFRTDPNIFDGRFANNGWLQELPKPLTKITWDNAALISPATAETLRLPNRNGWKGTEVLVGNIRIDHGGKSITCPTWVMPGQPDNVVTLHFGYGRQKVGRVGNKIGFNAFEIRNSASPWAATGVNVQSAPGEYPLAVTQLHFNMEGRDVLRTGTLAEYVQITSEGAKGHGGGAPEGSSGAGHEGTEHRKAFGEKDPPTHVPGPDETLYGHEHTYEGYAWGMAIDANSCIGCNACIVACQSENNIAVVGKIQVARSREMHWLRVDAYYEGLNATEPGGPYFMPVPCMHCENAPCEPVCPVHATVHSAEGINDMVYNRCVGTRYCSNNCPYKVRRFNFLLYQDWETPTYQLMRNPEVTVRSRGVMEKCTYCIQRIQEAKIGAELEDRPVRDGEIVTACQAVCPTETIVFGNINDPNSRVAKLKAESRNYSLLSDLNTRPRTTYLGALRNPNPEIAS